MRVVRTDLKAKGLKETPKAERVSRVVKEMEGKLEMAEANIKFHKEGGAHAVKQRDAKKREIESCLREDSRKEQYIAEQASKNIELQGRCNQLEVQLMAQTVRMETLQKEEAMSVAWYRGRIERMVAARE